MFPIIPYNLCPPRHACAPEIAYRKPRVVAASDLPKDTCSRLLEPGCLRGKVEAGESQLKVGLDADGHLHEPITNQIHWIKNIRLSDDCHNYNTKLSLVNADNQQVKLLIEITKPVKYGQELLLWFSEDVLAIFQMAFLTPSNIQGQKRYVCNICSASFEYPNPLKLHITLNCNRLDINVLWDRLMTATKSETSTGKFKFELKSLLGQSKYSKVEEKSSCSTKLYAHSLLASSKIQDVPAIPESEPIRSFSEPRLSHNSAFKPYTTKKPQTNNNTIRLSQSLHNFATISQNMSQESNLSELLRGSFPPVSYNHAAQMETLVSSLGKSKQGHLCIYCGKCYSRKYGLKIHIRTHTGYKPLKCKFCLRPFGDPSNLNKHVRLHAEGETPYKCELCGKILVRRRDLERHLKSRHSNDSSMVDNADATSTDELSSD